MQPVGPLPVPLLAQVQPQLARLLVLWRRDREPGLASAPRKADPAGAIDLDAIDARFKAAGSPLRVRR